MVDRCIRAAYVAALLILLVVTAIQQVELHNAEKRIDGLERNQIEIVGSMRDMTNIVEKIVGRL